MPPKMRTLPSPKIPIQQSIDLALHHTKKFPTDKSVIFLAAKLQNFCLTHGRGELCSPAGDRRSPLRIHINFGRELVISADLCYNGVSKKASPFGRGGGEADGEGQMMD